MTAEISQLKQEVAELWNRYRKEQPRFVDDESRSRLAEQNRTLEAKRRSLSERSAGLRTQLERQRQQASQLAPVVRVAGGLLGGLLTAAALSTMLPQLAEFSTALSRGQGLVVLSCALLLVAISVSRAEH